LFYITPFGFVEGLCSRDKIYKNSNGLNISVGDELLGRVVDPFMNPIDGKGVLLSTQTAPIIKPPIEPMRRGLIDEVFSVGVRSIDAFLTCGKGQKLGIFAGSGVGSGSVVVKCLNLFRKI